MKLYIEHREGKIYLRQKINVRGVQRDQYRIFKTVEDTPANLKDIRRWAEAVGHTIEKT